MPNKTDYNRRADNFPLYRELRALMNNRDPLYLGAIHVSLTPAFTEEVDYMRKLVTAKFKGAEVQVIHKSKLTGAITVEFLEVSGSYQIGARIVVPQRELAEVVVKRLDL